MAWMDVGDWVRDRTFLTKVYFNMEEPDRPVVEDMKRVAKHKKRRLDRVALLHSRAQVDPYFNRLHDALEVVYYKYWKEGKSKPFLGFTKPFTRVQSKVLFDKIHACLWHLHKLAIHRINKTLDVDKIVPQEKYRYTRDDDGVILQDGIALSRSILKENIGVTREILKGLPPIIVNQEDLD